MNGHNYKWMANHNYKYLWLNSAITSSGKINGNYHPVHVQKSNWIVNIYLLINVFFNVENQMPGILTWILIIMNVLFHVKHQWFKWRNCCSCQNLWRKTSIVGMVKYRTPAKTMLFRQLLQCPNFQSIWNNVSMFLNTKIECITMGHKTYCSLSTAFMKCFFT